MAFVEFESSQEALRALAKDRAVFSPAHGDRFCTLQLVGHHEMKNASVRRESEIKALGNGPISSLMSMPPIRGIGAGAGPRGAPAAGLAGTLGPGMPGVALPDSSTWQAMVDPGTGIVFYQNVATGEKSWTDPLFGAIAG
uniref:Rna binding protein n=2 Tax=Tetraselmis sp. GSL018 TaxID=582737 RepID=A0A061RJM9_9CHLO